MKSYRTYAATALIAASSFACAGDFDPGSRVTSLRILAVHADLPFAAPGETVSLDALAFDPKQGMPPVKWAWATCTNPEASTVDACFAQMAQESALTGTPPAVTTGVDLRTFAFTVPPDAIASLPPDAAANAYVGIVTVACPGDLVPIVSPSGSDALPFRCDEIGSGRQLGLDEYEVGIKRVFVRAHDRNANPAIAQLTWDGVEWPESEVKDVGACATTGNMFSDCDGAEKHTISVNVTSDSYQSGVDEFGSPFNEQLIVQYYATEGIFEHDTRIARDPASQWVARSAASGKTVSMFIVARDSRGGAVWATRRVAVR